MQLLFSVLCDVIFIIYVIWVILIILHTESNSHRRLAGDVDLFVRIVLSYRIDYSVAKEIVHVQFEIARKIPTIGGPYFISKLSQHKRKFARVFLPRDAMHPRY